MVEQKRTNTPRKKINKSSAVNFFIKIKALIVIILTISALVLNDDEKQKSSDKIEALIYKMVGRDGFEPS